MAINEYSILIDGEQVKEIRCKNDDCRRLLGYENIKVGTLVFVCPRCREISKFRIGYKQAYENFVNQLQKKFEGG